jgi:hypothetical protein
MPKPSVLPVPVRAWPMTSDPASAMGSVSSWIANARVMPTAASASTVSCRTPSAANSGFASLTGARAASSSTVSTSGAPVVA